MTKSILDGMRNDEQGRFVLFGVLVPIHFFLLSWIADCCSPTSDEAAHLAAGVRIWTEGAFDLYPVNPPLVKAIAALPVVCDGPKTDWSGLTADPTRRPEWSVGANFATANGARCLRYYLAARWACIPFSILGMIYCYRWARMLFGASAGLIAAAIWCFSPEILGNGALITPDVPAAALGLVAMFHFRQWLVDPSWGRAVASGLCLGLAELTKMSWLVLYGVMPALWILSEFRSRYSMAVLRTHAAQLAVQLMLSIYVMNLGYGFEGSFTRLEDFTFVSQALRGTTETRPGNRFRDMALGRMPIPLPSSYITGLDLQRLDLEGEGLTRFSYLRGEQRTEGWWYYYLYGLAVKLPAGTWLMAVAATLTWTAANRPRVPLPLVWESAFLLSPAIVLFIVVSSYTHVTRYVRYVLPCLPMLYIWASRFASSTPWPRPRIARVAGALGLVATIVSSVGVYPHELAYFNEFAGGPLRGDFHLLDSNIDWGQDLYRLKEWLDDHPEARPVKIAYTGPFRPRNVGIDEDSTDGRPKVPGAVLPRWSAVSVNQLHGYDSKRSQWERYLSTPPKGRAGYSIRIYDSSGPQDHPSE